MFSEPLLIIGILAAVALAVGALKCVGKLVRVVAIFAIIGVAAYYFLGGFVK